MGRFQVSTNITTTYGANKDGAGRIVAKGAGKQKTVPYNHERTPGENHGDAAGELIKTLVSPERRGFLKETAKVVDLGNGKMRFTVSL
jgi:hypothetical protein